MSRRPLPALAAAALAIAPAARSQCLDALTVPRAEHATVALTDRVLVAGGLDGAGGDLVTDAVEIYDAVTESWSTATLSSPRAGLAGARASQLALLAGGARWDAGTGRWIVTDAVDVYDGLTGSWSTASLSQARTGAVGVGAASRALFAGGVVWTSPTQAVPSDVVDLYDDLTGAWTTAQLSSPRTGVAAAPALLSVYFAGGSDGQLGALSDAVDVHDLLTGAWSQLRLPVPRTHMAAASYGGRVFFAGGFVFDPEDPGEVVPTDRVDIYHAIDGRWTTERLSSARWGLGAAVLGDLVVFAGGDRGLSAESAVVDLRDMTSGRWSTATLLTGRSEPGAVQVGDRIVLAGGWGSGGAGQPSSPTALVELLRRGFPRSFCEGDGAGTPCPCGNTGARGSGCANASGRVGRLVAAGCHELSNEDVVFDASGLPAGQAAVLFAGLDGVGGGDGASFGDGLRCVGGGVKRFDVMTSSPVGSASWGPGLPAAAGWVPGDVRRLQVWYRDPGAGGCGGGFNTTNGVVVEWRP